jgi:transposase
MNIQFLFENGKGSVVDEYGRPKPVDYIIDEEQFRLETLSSHTQYLSQLPLESEKRIDAMQVEKEAKPNGDVIMRETSVKRNYTHYSDQDKVRFFKLLFERCLSAASAATQLGIHVRTAQKWAKQYEKDPDSIFEKRRKTGRPHILHDEHKKAILECIDENPSIVLDEVMKKLKQMFTELKVSKTTLFDFVKQHCNLSLKKARLQPKDRNSEEKIQERLDWIRKWEKTDMNFTRNCVFLDESAFHINLKRSMAWSKKGTPAVVTVPKTRATTTTILGAISAEGLIKCSLRLPQPPSNKKRKRGDGIERVSKGTVTGHYVTFLKATMDEMDQYPHMKGHYLVMDNAPIHTSEDIAKYVESRGYRCVYLPPYSPELNPIEQFWSVVKSKVKRNKFLEKETLMARITEASNSLKLSDFKGIVGYSHKCLNKCRNRQAL